MGIRNTIIFLPAIVLALLTVACTYSSYEPPYQVENAPIPVGAQEKSLDQIGKYILSAAVARGWILTDLGPGHFVGNLKVRDHTVVVDIFYDQNGYSIQYKNSISMKIFCSQLDLAIQNFIVTTGGAECKPAYIHPNYNKWVRGLEGGIIAQLNLIAVDSALASQEGQHRGRGNSGGTPPAVAKLELPKPARAKPAVVKQQTGAKLAIFPEVLVGDSPQAAEIESAKLAVRISRQVAKHPGSVYVAYSYLDRPKEEHAGLRQTVWTIGNMSARPNVGGMHSRGKALGVDVVMQVLIRIDDMENPRSGTYEATYDVHVLEVNSRHHFKISGNTSGKIGWELLNEVESSIGEAIEKYKSTAPQ